MKYITDLIKRYRTNQYLAVQERAIFKAVEGFVIGVLIDLLPNAGSILAGISAGTVHINWVGVGVSGGIGALCAGLLKLVKSGDYGLIKALAQVVEIMKTTAAGEVASGFPMPTGSNQTSQTAPEQQAH